MYYRDLESNHIVYEAAKDSKGKPTTIAVDGKERKARHDAAMKSACTRRMAVVREKAAMIRREKRQ